MLIAPAPGQPVRVIYAKLTSTGAYDVVARTPGVSLEDARTLAERLLPGNPPLGAASAEEVAHVRPPEGGHIVWRFARYGWSDGDRGDVYVTDIAWYADADFASARGDAFALVPRTDQVFAAATELPPFTVAAGVANEEWGRIAELHARVAADARTVIASAVAGDPVLLIHAGERAAALELCTLLLPPQLRPELTFQTQAFRVPPVLPRITLADRGYANLREAPWKVLPSVDVDVPLELAGRFVSLGSEPAALAVAHELYEEAYPDASGLRQAITRVVALAGVAAALGARDATAVLGAVAPLEPAVAAAALRRLRGMAGDAAVREALLELLAQPGTGAERVCAALDALGEVPPATVAALVDALRVGAPAELVAELAGRCAAVDDVPRLVQLVTLDRRAAVAGGQLPGLAARPDTRRLLDALHDHDPAAVLGAAAAMHGAVRGTAAAEALDRLCRDAVADAVSHAQPTGASVDALLRLAVAADTYVAATGGKSRLPALVADYELSAPDAARRAAAEHGPAARAALGAAVLVRACEAAAGSRGAIAAQLSEGAVTLLASSDRRQLEQVRQVLQQRGVSEPQLLALPGAEALLPLLGGSVQQAAVIRRIVSAIEEVGAGREAAVQELATAVVAAHGQRVRITSGSELSASVLRALERLPRAPNGAEQPAAAVEVCLELLGVITETSHFPELEDAALGGSMSARLQRLDRSIAHCRAVEREDRYEWYAAAIESPDVAVTEAVRERLREALGTRGLQRRLLRAVASVIARDRV